jgi:hypothetical protein
LRYWCSLVGSASPTLLTQDRNSSSDCERASSFAAPAGAHDSVTQLVLGVESTPVRLELAAERGGVRIGFRKQTSQISDETAEIVGTDVERAYALGHAIPHLTLV